MKLQVETTIAAARQKVWAYLEDIGSHVEWMADAVSIDFLSSQRTGVGTRFACKTRVGPLHTTDIMEITAWSPPSLMGVRHRGAVSGEGRFELTELGPDRDTTKMVWVESLRLPWWLGGPIGALGARPILRRIWRGNLARLKSRIEADAGGA